MWPCFCVQGNGLEKPRILIVELLNGLMYPAVPYIKDQILMKGKGGKYTDVYEALKFTVTDHAVGLRRRVATLGKLLTHTRLCHQAEQFCRPTDVG